MADINLHIIASQAATQDTRQTAQRSPVPRVVRESTAAGQHARQNVPAYDTTKPVAFDVLLAAQQARTPDRVRAFDVRGAYGDKSHTPRRSENSRNADADAPPQSGVFVDQATAQPAADATSDATAWLDNVVPLPGVSLQDAGARAQDGLSQSANRAYVNAGAFDGRAFATAGLDGRPRPDVQGFDLLV